MTKNKPIIAIVSLTCCEGCQVAILDLGQKMLDLFEHAAIGDFIMLEDTPEAKNYDVVFVEGAPITKENIARLKDLRGRSKILVALGACAALGGIAEIKNYQDKAERLRYVYPHTLMTEKETSAGKIENNKNSSDILNKTKKGVGVYKNIESINNPDIKPLSYYVKVDLEIKGCPINNKEFLKIAQQLITGIPVKIPERPVCYECQLKQNKCLLQEGQPCLGPIICGGCGAPCPSSNYPCDGCRGPLKNANPANLNKQLAKQGYSRMEIDMIMQRFGMEDVINPEPSDIK